MTTLDDLVARLEALEAELASRPALPPVNEAWGSRTCQLCGAEATVIDVSAETRAHTRNGEGYCATHAASVGVLDREHLTR